MAVLYLLFEEFRRQRFFFATKAGGNGLLKKMRPGAIDGAITLRRWNMTIPILRVEFATAKNAGSAHHPRL
ncbi:MAG: hypothetical protein DMF11_03855 [Verrucomicrobia bacterium]|nr:MAG: hypothetical protein DMF11_03855 [Verrucomicrobiota bacterium]